MSSSTRSQATLLQETLDVALNRLEALEQAQLRVNQENAELRQRLDARPPRPPSPEARHVKEPKVSSPDTFHGRNKAKLEHFLLAINIVFNTQPLRYSTDLTKIHYAISFLRDDAMAWVTPFTNKPDDLKPDFLKNYDLFVKELKTIFGDPDEVATAERDIRKLRQRGPASSYFADFRRLAAVLDWNDSALNSQAYSGLKDFIKDEFARTGRPETLAELITSATRIDNRMHERQVEKERNSSQTNQTNSSKTTGYSTRRYDAPSSSMNPAVKQEPKTSTNSSSGPRGPLSDEEKERRRRENLCLYCASKDHLINARPITKPGSYNRSTNTSDPSKKKN